MASEKHYILILASSNAAMVSACLEYFYSSVSIFGEVVIDLFCDGRVVTKSMELRIIIRMLIKSFVKMAATFIINKIIALWNDLLSTQFFSNVDRLLISVPFQVQ